MAPTRFLTRLGTPLLLAAAVLTALAWAPSSRLKLDRSIESLFADDDARLRAYQKSRRLFGGDEFVIVAWEQDEPFSREGRDAIAAFAAELSTVAGINPASTQDLGNALDLTGIDAVLDEFLGSTLGFLRGGVRRAAQATMEERLTAFSRGLLVGEDDKTVAVILRLEPAGSSAVDRGETFARVRRIADAHDPPASVVGEPIQVHDAFVAVEEDARLLFFAALGLLGAVLLVLFRNPRWVVLPLFIVVTAVTWTRAGLTLSGAELSMVSSMLDALVTIIGVAAVTHVAVRFKAERADHDRPTAMRRTLAGLAAPVFWAAATTATGFLSLLVSSVTPVRSFGLMMAAGTGAVLLAVAAVVPGGTLVGGVATDPRAAPGEGGLAAGLGRLVGVVDRLRWPIRLAAVLVFAFAAVGVTRLTVETDFSKNFRPDSPIVRSLAFVEDRLGGAGSWEINFPAPPLAGLDADYLDRVAGLAGRLREIDGVTKVVAISDGLDLLPGLLATGDPAKDFDTIGSLQPEFVPSLYRPDEGRMRIVLRSFERRPADVKKAIIDAATQEARKAFPELAPDDVEATGLYVLLTFLIDGLLRDQLTSFLVAAAGIAAMTACAVGDARLGLASLVPNVTPILLVVGGLGWWGVPVNIGTAMIASVSIGLTIDGSIHYLVAYREAIKTGLSPAQALAATHRQVGRALVFATIALTAGFAVLTASRFIPLVYFGALTGLSLLGGLIGNLILLPLLVGRSATPLKPEPSGEGEPVGDVENPSPDGSGS